LLDDLVHPQTWRIVQWLRRRGTRRGLRPEQAAPAGAR